MQNSVLLAYIPFSIHVNLLFQKDQNKIVHNLGVSLTIDHEREQATASQTQTLTQSPPSSNKKVIVCHSLIPFHRRLFTSLSVIF